MAPAVAPAPVAVPPRVVGFERRRLVEHHPDRHTQLPDNLPGDRVPKQHATRSPRLAGDGRGGFLNVNADVLAAELAVALEKRFVDHEHGGVFWMLDPAGRPIADRRRDPFFTRPDVLARFFPNTELMVIDASSEMPEVDIWLSAKRRLVW